MARRVFYSFHYQPDCWRTSQVRNIGIVEGNRPASDNDWQAITRGGPIAVQRWIDRQMEGRSCTVVLIGSATAGRKWINYEIRKSWSEGKGLVGIYIHNLKDNHRRQSTQGANLFDRFTLNGTKLSSIVRAHNPPYSDSQAVYAYICNNFAKWIEEAIRIRQNC